MILLDVNVLLRAFMEEMPDHARYREYLNKVAAGPEPYGLFDLVLSAVVRISTNPRVYQRPATTEAAADFVQALRARPHCVHIEPGPRHWDIFINLCRQVGARANVAPTRTWPRSRSSRKANGSPPTAG